MSHLWEHFHQPNRLSNKSFVMSSFTGKQGVQTSPWFPEPERDDPGTSWRTLGGSALHRLATSWNTEQQRSKGHWRVYSSRRNKNGFLTQKGCCQTESAPFLCHLSSALCLVTANAGRWRPHGRMGRECPESCKKGQGQIFHFKTAAFCVAYPPIELLLLYGIFIIFILSILCLSFLQKILLALNCMNLNWENMCVRLLLRTRLTTTQIFIFQLIMRSLRFDNPFFILWCLPYMRTELQVHKNANNSQWQIAWALI